MSTFSDTQRLELEPFGITVVNLKSGAVQSNILLNTQKKAYPTLPKGSIYEPAREVIEKAMKGEKIMESAMQTEPWAKEVVQNLLRKKPSPNIWSGSGAWLIRLSMVLPFGMLDGVLKKLTGLSVVGQILKNTGMSR